MKHNLKDKFILSARYLKHYDKREPLYVGFDPGDFCSLIVAQKKEYGQRLDIIKEFWAYLPDSQDSLAQQIYQFFGADAVNKVIHLYPDRAGNKRREEPSFMIIIGLEAVALIAILALLFTYDGENHRLKNLDCAREDGKPYPKVFDGEYEVVYKFDVASLLDYYRGIFSFSALQTITGINQKQLCHYASGISKPRPQQAAKIANGLHRLAKELMTVTV